MVLVDTSVWIDHFRRSHEGLKRLLLDREVLCHPFIVGELACGQLRHRAEMLKLLQLLPRAVAVTNEETFRFIEDHQLFGRGLGWVDVHLVLSARRSGCPVWTLDRRLRDTCRRLNLAYDPAVEKQPS